MPPRRPPPPRGEPRRSRSPPRGPGGRQWHTRFPCCSPSPRRPCRTGTWPSPLSARQGKPLQVLELIGIEPRSIDPVRVESDQPGSGRKLDPVDQIARPVEHVENADLDPEWQAARYPEAAAVVEEGPAIVSKIDWRLDLGE